MELALSVFGVAQCDGGDETLGVFFSALRWLTVVQTSYVPSNDAPQVGPVAETAKSFERHFAAEAGRNLSPLELRKVGILLMKEPVGSAIGARGGLPDNWQVVPARGVRQYRAVDDLPTYLDVVQQAAPRIYGLGPPRCTTVPGAGFAVTNTAARATVVSVEPTCVFVIMPFGEPWSDRVYEMVTRAAETLSGQSTLKVERADGFAEPGRITEQIEDALKRAAVVVADITNTVADLNKDVAYPEPQRHVGTWICLRPRGNHSSSTKTRMPLRSTYMSTGRSNTKLRQRRTTL